MPAAVKFPFLRQPRHPTTCHTTTPPKRKIVGTTASRIAWLIIRSFPLSLGLGLALGFCGHTRSRHLRFIGGSQCFQFFPFTKVKTRHHSFDWTMLYPTVLINYLRPGKITLARRRKNDDPREGKIEMAEVERWSLQKGLGYGQNFAPGAKVSFSGAIPLDENTTLAKEKNRKHWLPPILV